MPKRAEIDLNKKLSLERSFLIEITQIFREISQYSGRAFFNVFAFEQTIEDALEDHYLNVFAVFGDDYQNRANVQMPNIQRLSYESHIGSSFDQRAMSQAALISKTNERQLHKSRALARRDIKGARETNPD